MSDEPDRDDVPDLWLAYYPDASGVVVLAREIDALRHAVAHGMYVTSAAYGDDVIEVARNASH